MWEKLRGDYAAILWTIVRIYLGWQWLTSGYGKLSSGEFSAKKFLEFAIKKAEGDHPAVQGWYASFLNNFALPNVSLFDFLIPWGEFLVGVGLILGLFTSVALYIGAFMNLNFMLAGSTSSNPIMFTLAIILLAARPASYRYGLDYYVLPIFRKKE